MIIPQIFFHSSFVQRQWPVGLLLIWVALLLALSPEWIFTPVSFVDPAVYIGWFLHPAHYRAIFPFAHAGDLLPFIMPNALAYHLAGPVIGNVIIKTVTLFLSALCMLTIVRKLFNLQSALICVIAFTCSRYVLMAIGADYTDGRVMLYLLLTAACAVSAGAREQDMDARQGRYVCSMYALAGVWALCMISTAILTVVVLPFLFGLCLTDKQPMRAMMWMAAGFMTAAACCAGFDIVVMNGDGFYLRNVVRRALVFINEIRVVIGDWKAVGMWLVMPVILVPAGIVAGIVLIKREAGFALSEWRGRAVLCLVLGSIIAYSAYVGLQYFRHQETLSNGFYLNFISPLSFMLLGAVMVGLLRDVPVHIQWVVIGLFACCSLQIVAGLNQPAPVLQQWAQSPTYAAEIAVAALCVVVLVIAAKYPVGRLAGVLVVLFCANYGSATPIFPNQLAAIGREANFKTVLEWMAQVDAQDPSRKSYVWYDVHERAGAAYMEMGAASHMWSEWGLVSEYLPKLDHHTYELIRRDIKHTDHARLYLFAETPSTIMRAKKTLMELGLRGEVMEQRQYQSNGIAFEVMQLDLTKLR